jgi:hypothetical protein
MLEAASFFGLLLPTQMEKVTYLYPHIQVWSDLYDIPLSCMISNSRKGDYNYEEWMQ